jgi:ABC-type uncharacterized transport system permease subunit
MTANACQAPFFKILIALDAGRAIVLSEAEGKRSMYQVPFLQNLVNLTYEKKTTNLASSG